MKGTLSKRNTKYKLTNLKGDSSHKVIFWTMVMLAWPTIVEYFLETIVQYVDTAMVGQVSAEASAVVGLSTSLNWLVNSPLFAVGIGFLAMVAKATGDDDPKAIKRAADQAILLVIGLSVAEGILAIAMSPFIPKWMGADKLIWQDASIYFAVICMPMIFRASIIIFGSLLRATGDTKTPLKINLLVNGTNVLLNLLFIYPSRTIYIVDQPVKIWGLGLGTFGAGLATAIAFVIGGGLMWRAFSQNASLHQGLKHIKFEKDTMIKGLKISLPIALNKTVTSLGYVVFSGLVSSMGTFIFAAHTIAIVAESIFYVPGYGMQAATSTMIGYTLGKRDWQLYMRTVLLNVMFIAVLMMPASLLLYKFAVPIMHFFTQEAAVIALGAKVLRYVAFSEPFFGVSIILEGVYNGLGKTTYPFAVETTSMWLIRIVGVIIILHLPGATLTKVWLYMIADNLVKTILFGWGIFHFKNRMRLFEKALATHS
ncbi:MATE family efflux transporter [Fusibacter ferrireducens]|uniref:Probable multidrug resistance protein NorM n=1 Tax=Fusibacter ferrireducens TaxID=2785058 RepID=A0ABR9ZZ52_9FIRM|nr:MATE family efflux transporter [Fusibacter ferrireducens]MBF4695175.1 MATE family efflux transporter [Fusibacter ferrireducens]